MGHVLPGAASRDGRSKKEDLQGLDPAGPLHLDVGDITNTNEIPPSPSSKGTSFAAFFEDAKKQEDLDHPEHWCAGKKRSQILVAGSPARTPSRDGPGRDLVLNFSAETKSLVLSKTRGQQPEGPWAGGGGWSEWPWGASLALLQGERRGDETWWAKERVLWR